MFRPKLGQNETYAYKLNIIFLLRIMVFRSIKTDVSFNGLRPIQETLDRFCYHCVCCTTFIGQLQEPAAAD